MLITTAGQKGGPGKTTAAVNLAVWRSMQGRRVLVVDSDQKSKSASRWATKRIQAGVEPRIPCVNLYGETLLEQIAMVSDGKFDDVVVDVGGADSVELRTVLSAADVAVVPCIVSGFDLDTMGEVDTVVRLARGGNRKLRALMFMNVASSHPRDKEEPEAREAVSVLSSLTLVEKKWCFRRAFRDCAKFGASVFELDDGKALAEVEALAVEVWK